MAALLGKVEDFDPAQEDWPQYVERLEQFFEANDLRSNDVLGPAPYKLLRNLIALIKPTDKTLEELVTEHYSPQFSALLIQLLCKESRRICNRVCRRPRVDK